MIIPVKKGNSELKSLNSTWKTNLVTGEKELGKYSHWMIDIRET